MSLARVAGHPDYSSAGTNNFIPEIWSGKLQEKFYKTTVFKAISNTDYEGEIKDQGDKVIIRTIPTLTISDYQKGQKLNYERPESPSLELLIDKGKYFAFVIDDVDKYQSDLRLMNNWSDDAAEQMKIKIDAQVLEKVTYNGADFPGDSSNEGATAGKVSSSFNLGTSSAVVQITKSNVIEYIVDCMTVLDEQNVPETGRWMVIPSWFANLLKKSDIKDASMTGDGTSVLRNGRIGMVDRATLYLSNNLYNSSTTYYVPFGTNHAITFASQMTKMETLRAESTFGDLVRGLNVYGFKVVKPEALGLLICKK